MPSAKSGQNEPPTQQLVNLGNYPVEAHLPDRVVLLIPGESVWITHIGGQVAELARRGLVELRPVPPEPQPAKRRQAARPANPARRQRSTSKKQADRPVGRTGRTRGGA